jgi:hypothetical protein
MALLRAARDDIDHAGQRVGTVNRGLRAAHHLDALHAVGIEVGKIKTAAAKVAGIIHRDAVHQHQREVGFTAAYGHRRQTAGAALLLNQQAGQGFEQVGDRGFIQRLDLLRIQHRHRGGQCRLRRKRAGYQHVLERGIRCGCDCAALFTAFCTAHSIACQRREKYCDDPV